MAQKEKVIITLSFNKKINPSHRNKVKDFWNFLDSTNQLKPYTVTSEKTVQVSKDSDEEDQKLSKLWSDQFQVFQEYGLDKAAIAATKTCKVCHEESKCRSSEYADTVNETYEQILNDIKIYDERLEKNAKNPTALNPKRPSIP
ncbi:uncharacterized protein LOC143179583 [Calliopsis andreniformis]|uniref:uncharacterized protein LOC143179583 n=1 Tax=Calliopsis andreniformis TaxID=337506 RepID=UPI003FCCCD4A